MNADEQRLEWEGLFRKWWERLNEDGGWRIEITPYQFVDGYADCECSYSHKCVTFRYGPRTRPSNFLACHEVVHAIVMRLWSPAYDAIGRLGDSQEAIRGFLKDEMEGVVDTLARAFLRAYGETESGDPPMNTDEHGLAVLVVTRGEEEMGVYGPVESMKKAADMATTRAVMEGGQTIHVCPLQSLERLDG